MTEYYYFADTGEILHAENVVPIDNILFATIIEEAIDLGYDIKHHHHRQDGSYLKILNRKFAIRFYHDEIRVLSFAANAGPEISVSYTQYTTLAQLIEQYCG